MIPLKPSNEKRKISKIDSLISITIKSPYEITLNNCLYPFICR